MNYDVIGIIIVGFILWESLGIITYKLWNKMFDISYFKEGAIATSMMLSFTVIPFIFIYKLYKIVLNLVKFIKSK